MSLANLATATVVIETFDLVPPSVQCDELWTNQNIVLRFTPTIASEGTTAGRCSFGVSPGAVDLYPSRFLVDFSLLPQPVSRIEADLEDYGNTAMFAYHGPTNIAQIAAPTNGTYSLNFTTLHPDTCSIRSTEGRVNEIRVFTISIPQLAIARTNSSVAVLWPTNASLYRLEKTTSLAASAGWVQETNSIQVEGTNYVYHPSTLLEAEFFRLRQE